jgi:hypothetical protein
LDWSPTTIIIMIARSVSAIVIEWSFIRIEVFRVSPKSAIYYKKNAFLQVSMIFLLFSYFSDKIYLYILNHSMFRIILSILIVLMGIMHIPMSNANSDMTSPGFTIDLDPMDPLGEADEIT